MLKYGKSAIFSGALLYFFTAPFFSWPFLRVTGIKIILYYLFGFICFKQIKKIDKHDKMLIGLFVFTSFLYGLTSPNEIIIKVLLCISFIPVVVAPFCNDSYLKKVYSAFESIYVYIMAGSLLCYLASNIGIIGPLFSMNGLITELGDQAYDVYGLCVKQNVYSTIRFYGPYDEPGVIGTYSALMLIVNKFSLKSFKNWIHIIAGVLSFSLFFFIIIGVYILFSAIYHRKIVPVLLLLIFVPYVYNQTSDDLEFQIRVWNRFAINDGELGGNDRSSEYLDQYYNSKKYSLEYWFGVDNWESVVNQLDGESSYKIVVLQNGMLFLALYCVFFILYGYKYLKKDKLSYLLYLFVFLGCIYQRTNVYGMVTVFLFCYFARFYLEGNSRLIKNDLNICVK